MSVVDELRTKCDWCEPCDQCVVLMENAAQEIDRLTRERDELRAVARMCVYAVEEYERYPWLKD